MQVVQLVAEQGLALGLAQGLVQGLAQGLAEEVGEEEEGVEEEDEEEKVAAQNNHRPLTVSLKDWVSLPISPKLKFRIN